MIEVISCRGRWLASGLPGAERADHEAETAGRGCAWQGDGRVGSATQSTADQHGAPAERAQRLRGDHARIRHPRDVLQRKTRAPPKLGARCAWAQRQNVDRLAAQLFGQALRQHKVKCLARRVGRKIGQGRERGCARDDDQTSASTFRPRLCQHVGQKRAGENQRRHYIQLNRATRFFKFVIKQPAELAATRVVDQEIDADLACARDDTLATLIGAEVSGQTGDALGPQWPA